MARIDSLRSLLVQQLRDLYDAEKRLTKAIPKLVPPDTKWLEVTIDYGKDVTRPNTAIPISCTAA